MVSSYPRSCSEMLPYLCLPGELGIFPRGALGFSPRALLLPRALVGMPLVPRGESCPLSDAADGLGDSLPLVVAFFVRRAEGGTPCFAALDMASVGVALGCHAAGAAVEGAIACATAVCTAAANSSCARFAAAGDAAEAAPTASAAAAASSGVGNRPLKLSWSTVPPSAANASRSPRSGPATSTRRSRSASAPTCPSAT